MESPHVAHRRFAPTALMLGNIVDRLLGAGAGGHADRIVVTVSMSASATPDLLITFGAVMLCIGSPLTAWLTSRIERRTLLATTLAVLAR